MDVIKTDASQDSFTDTLNHFTALHKRFGPYPVKRITVFFNNGRILGHINQSSGQIPGVCRLQRRIGKTLTGAVG